jgi:hypothetical protein
MAATGCHNCNKPGSKPCGGCRDVVYCSKVCQRKDWPTHKPVCQMSWTKHDAPADTRFADSQEFLVEFVRDEAHGRCVRAAAAIAADTVLWRERPMSLVARLQEESNTGEVVPAAGFPGASIAHATSLASETYHLATLRKVWKMNVNTQSAYLEKRADVSDEKLVGRHQLGLDDPYMMRTCGTGFYSLATWLNVSCEPNARGIVDQDAYFAVVTTKDVAAGEEINIPSLPAAFLETVCWCKRGLMMRRARLADTACWCARCERERGEHEECAAETIVAEDGADIKALVPRTMQLIEHMHQQNIPLTMAPPRPAASLLLAFASDVLKAGLPRLTQSRKTFEDICHIFPLFAPEHASIAVNWEPEAKCIVVNAMQQLSGAAQRMPPNFLPRPQYFDMVALVVRQPPTGVEIYGHVMDAWHESVRAQYAAGGIMPVCAVLPSFGTKMFEAIREAAGVIRPELRPLKDGAGAAEPEPS